MGLTWRPLRRSSTGRIPLGYPSQTDACWARSPRGLAPWTCRTRGNLFTCATKICRLEATLGMDSSNVHFFLGCQKCDLACVTTTEYGPTPHWCWRGREAEDGDVHGNL